MRYATAYVTLAEVETVVVVALVLLAIWWMMGSTRKRATSAADATPIAVSREMESLLRPFSTSIEVDFERMKLWRDGREYDLATGRNESWFVKLVSVSNFGTTRLAEAYVRETSSGRLDEEELELAEAALSEWKEKNPDASEDDWEHSIRIEDVRDAIKKRREQASRELTTFEKANRELFAAKNLEWIRVPPREEGWIEASYNRCLGHFQRNVGLNPGRSLEAFVGSPSEDIWEPPRHATVQELQDSWARVEDRKRAMRDAYREEGRRCGSRPDAVDRFVEPWTDLNRY